VSTDAQSAATPEPDPKSPSRFRQSAAIIAVTAAIAGAGGAAIYAATDHPTDGHHGPWRPPGPPPGGPGGPGNGRSAANAGAGSMDEQALHGEFVARDADGSYRTTLVQTGTITAISPQSITARSDDGYTQTYVIPPAAAQGAPPFTVNQYVTVRASRDGQVATITNIGFASPPSG
jgi:hypothetical protein